MEKNTLEDDFDVRLARSAAGRLAHNRGKLAGALLAKALGAQAETPGSNLYNIDGVTVRFHTISEGKWTFTVNPSTEPPCAIVVVADADTQPDTPARNRLIGVLLKDCLRAGRAHKSKNAPGRISLSLSMVPIVRLGDAYLPPRYTEAPTVLDRFDLMDQIGTLDPEELSGIMDMSTIQKLRDFVLASRPEAASVPATDELTNAAGPVTDSARSGT